MQKINSGPLTLKGEPGDDRNRDMMLRLEAESHFGSLASADALGSLAVENAKVELAAMQSYAGIQAAGRMVVVVR